MVNKIFLSKDQFAVHLEIFFQLEPGEPLHQIVWQEASPDTHLAALLTATRVLIVNTKVCIVKFI
jgi:hypothetical protein